MNVYNIFAKMSQNIHLLHHWLYSSCGMSKKKGHFIGIGGIGVSALARYFLAQNWLVSGSDVAKTVEVIEIQRDGAKVKISHKSSNIPRDSDLMIYSQAITPDNPEILEAKRLNIPLKSYPEALGNLTRKYKTIAIAGSHGKSTTTALTALIFMEAGLDPTVIIGTKLKEFGGRNFRLGKSEYLIIEADEYKDSFLNYYPQGILVTNVDREHLDHYKNFKNVKKGFLNFMSNLAPGGVLVLNEDNKPLLSLADKLRNRKNYLSAGRQVWFSLRDAKHAKQIKKILKIPGRHNISNALGAFQLAKSFGIKEKIILKALSKYGGAWRRMEYKGELRIMNDELWKKKNENDKLIIHNSQFIIPVYDDYAHHPTEIKATLKAFKEKYPKSLLICVFQPHQNRRLSILFKEFTSVFDEADILILLDIYKVSGRDKVSHNINSRKLAQAISKRRNRPKEVIYLPYPAKIKKLIQKILKANEAKKLKAVIVMMGAGDIYNLTGKLIR